LAIAIILIKLPPFPNVVERVIHNPQIESVCTYSRADNIIQAKKHDMLYFFSEDYYLLYHNILFPPVQLISNAIKTNSLHPKLFAKQSDYSYSGLRLIKFTGKEV
jgi:hypothetical protein